MDNEQFYKLSISSWITKKRPYLAKKKVAHTSAVATTKLIELGNDLLVHPPYS